LVGDDAASSNRRGKAMRRILIVITAVGLFFAVSALADPPAIHISVASTQPSDWTTDQLKTQFAAQIKSVDYESHGQKHTSTAVPLLAVLKAAGVGTDLKMDPKADPKTKNAALRMIVVVRGSDGYTVSLSLAELLPDIGNHDAWLALDADGAPLHDNEVPAKLILPADVKPGRWVRGIASISVADPSASNP
jgi:hypothetical protein